MPCIHLYVSPERRPSRPRGAACLRPVDVDEGEAPPVCADLQGRGLPGDDFHETEHLVLRHVLAADRGEEAPPSRGGSGSRLRQPVAEGGGVPLVPERRGHVHPCSLEHDGKAPLLGQHAGYEVLLVGTGRRLPAQPERVPEGPVWWYEAVAQIPREEPQGVARRVLLESAIPHRHRRWVRRRSQSIRVRRIC